MKTEKLNPCPFCSSDDVEVITSDPWLSPVMTNYVRCITCEARGPMHKRESDAIEQWNQAEPRINDEEN